MIAPLRRGHRRIFALLSVALPVLFVAAIASRPAPPAHAALPAALVADRTPIREQPAEPDPLLYWSAAEPKLGASLPADARLLGSLRSSEWLAGTANSKRPVGGSLLVYSLVNQQVTAILPADAIVGGAR